MYPNYNIGSPNMNRTMTTGGPSQQGTYPTPTAIKPPWPGWHWGDPTPGQPMGPTNPSPPSWMQLQGQPGPNGPSNAFQWPGGVYGGGPGANAVAGATTGSPWPGGVYIGAPTGSAAPVTSIPGYTSPLGPSAAPAAAPAAPPSIGLTGAEQSQLQNYLNSMYGNAAANNPMWGAGGGPSPNAGTSMAAANPNVYSQMMLSALASGNPQAIWSADQMQGVQNQIGNAMQGPAGSNTFDTAGFVNPGITGAQMQELLAKAGINDPTTSSGAAWSSIAGGWDPSTAGQNTLPAAYGGPAGGGLAPGSTSGGAGVAPGTIVPPNSQASASAFAPQGWTPGNQNWMASAGGGNMMAGGNGQGNIFTGQGMGGMPNLFGQQTSAAGAQTNAGPTSGMQSFIMSPDQNWNNWYQGGMATQPYNPNTQYTNSQGLTAPPGGYPVAYAGGGGGGFGPGWQVGPFNTPPSGAPPSGQPTTQGWPTGLAVPPGMMGGGPYGAMGFPSLNPDMNLQTGNVANIQPVNTTPAWNSMVAAMQQNEQMGAANLMSQYSLSGNLAGSPGAMALSNYYTQAGLQQQGLLGQMAVPAMEQAQQLGVGAEQQLSSQGFQSQMQQNSLAAQMAQQLSNQAFQGGLTQYQTGAGLAGQLASQDFQGQMAAYNAALAASQLGTQGAMGAAGNLSNLSAGAANQLLQNAMTGSTNLFNTANQAALGMYGGQNTALSNYMNYLQGNQRIGLGQALGLGDLANATLGLGSQLGGQQYNIGQSQINNLISNWMMGQPQYNPYLSLASGLANAYPPVYYPGYASGSLGSLLSGAGQLAGGIGALKDAFGNNNPTTTTPPFFNPEVGGGGLSIPGGGGSSYAYDPNTGYTPGGYTLPGGMPNMYTDYSGMSNNPYLGTGTINSNDIAIAEALGIPMYIP